MTKRLGGVGGNFIAQRNRIDIYEWMQGGDWNGMIKWEGRGKTGTRKGIWGGIAKEPLYGSIINTIDYS